MTTPSSRSRASRRTRSTLRPDRAADELDNLDESGILGRPYRALTFGIVATVLLIAFEATAVNTAMPVAARALHGVGRYAFAFSAYFTTSLLAMVVSGEWADRRGPRAPLGAGVLLFGAGLVIAGTAGSMWAFIGGRAVQGLGGGLVIVALYVVVGAAYPERLRARVFSAFSAAWVVPSIVGPALSGTVTQHLGWRWVFLAIPVLILLPLSLMLPQLRHLERAGGAPGPFDRRRVRLAAAVAVGAGLLQYAGQRLDPVSLLPAAAGAALLVPAVLRLLPPGTLRAGRGLPTVILLRGVAAGAFFATESFIPLMLVTQRGLSPTLAGLSLTSGGLTWAAGSWLQGRPWADGRRERLIRTGFLMAAAAIAAAGLALLPGVPAWVVAAAWALGGAGMGVLIASVGVLMLKLSPPAETGANSASLQVSDALGSIVLIGVGGVLFAALGGGSTAATTTHRATPAAFGVVFGLMAVVALAGALLAARTRPGR